MTDATCPHHHAPDHAEDQRARREFLATHMMASMTRTFMDRERALPSAATIDTYALQSVFMAERLMAALDTKEATA